MIFLEAILGYFKLEENAFSTFLSEEMRIVDAALLAAASVAWEFLSPYSENICIPGA
jgi:hypothetical protein